MFWNEHHPHTFSTSALLSPLPGHLQSRRQSVLWLFWCFQNCPPIFHLLILPSHTLLYASLWMWHRGTTSPPLSCPEVLVELRKWCAVGLFITTLKKEGWHRYRSRWHCTLGIIFSDKPGLGLRILAFACYSHSYQNITMKIRYFCRKGFKDFFFQRFKIVCV